MIATFIEQDFHKILYLLPTLQRGSVIEVISDGYSEVCSTFLVCVLLSILSVWAD